MTGILEEKGREVSTAHARTQKLAGFDSKIKIYKNYNEYWYNFRNIRALLVPYYATFESTI